MRYFKRIDLLEADFKNYAEDLSGKYRYAFPALADGVLRERWLELLKEWTYAIPAIIHSKASLDPSATYYECVSIDSGAQLSENCVVSIGCVIDADVVIGEGAYIDRFSYIGSGAVIEPQAIVPAFSVIERGRIVSITENPSASDFLKRSMGVAAYV